MQYSSLSLPIYNELFDVLDSSKITTFMECPRQYFYQYILGWRYKSSNIHLRFGSAMHEAMEYLMLCQDGVQVGYSADQALTAIHKFNDKFDELGDNGEGEVDGIDMLAGSSDPTNGAKDKSNAANAIIDYAKWYRRDNFKTLVTELAGTVLLGEDRILYCKPDAFYEQEGEIWGMDHKTTGKKGQSFLNDWPLKFQLGTYLTVGSMYYGEDFKGFKINGLVLRPPTKATGKANNEFLRIPVSLREDMLSAWLYQANYAIDLLDYNMVQLSRAKASDIVMEAFPCNPAACTKNYNGCPFNALCTSWANPLKHMDNMPSGFKVERWDPRTHETISEE